MLDAIWQASSAYSESEYVAPKSEGTTQRFVISTHSYLKETAGAGTFLQLPRPPPIFLVNYQPKTKRLSQ
jgi:hypothetical protein